MKKRGAGNITTGMLAAATIVALPHGQAMADSFQPGEFATYIWSQLGSIDNNYGMPTNPAGEAVLQYFDSVFAPSSDLMVIGTPGSAGKSIIFDSGQAVVSFLHDTGAAGALTSSLLDPLSSSGGELADEITALTVNTAFDAAGTPMFTGTSDVLLQNLTLTALTGDELWANGLSIGDVLAESNYVLGGGALPNNKTSYTAMAGLLINIDLSFSLGDNVSTWADQHLLMPTSNSGGGGTASAPEIDPMGLSGGITLLLGGLAVVRAQSRRVV
jgi:hypothetical protein